MKQFEMSQVFDVKKNKCIILFRRCKDKERIELALRGVDYVIHAAALKQVPAANIILLSASKQILMVLKSNTCCTKNKVKKVIALSTDKASNPINYMEHQNASDKLFISGNNFGGGITQFDR